MHASRTESEPLVRTWHPLQLRRLLPLVICFFSILLAVLVVGLFARESPNTNIIWLANGLLLAYLLLAPRWRWKFYFGVAFAGLVLGSYLIEEPWQINLLYNSLDMVEVGTAAVLLRRYAGRLPRFTDGAYVARFVCLGVLAGPLVAGSLTAAFSYFVWHRAPGLTLLHWLSGDSLGIAVGTPMFVAIFRHALAPPLAQRRNWIWLLLLACATLGIFVQSQFPILFLIYPFLLLVQLRLGMGWAAVGAIFVTLVGGSLTAHGYGPLSQAFVETPMMRPVLVQLFVIAAVIMMYSVSVVLENEKSIERRLQETVSIHRLIAENSRDIILLTDFEGRPNYVSPAVESVAGWKPEELMAMNGLDFVYAEDRSKIVAVIRAIRGGSEGGTVEHRARARDGEFIWVESSLRAIRHPVTRLPTGVLNIIRDISERKQAEEKLEAAYRTVEALAVVDPLTGLANRRRLDESLANEWRRGIRDRRPLSFLLLDVDYFKSFNDTYGHPRGDACLKQIAEAALDVVSRPGDLVARYGGEEFAVILPYADQDGVWEIAHKICAALRSRAIPHTANPEGIVTISIGCATLVPTMGQKADILVDMADEALYSAKKSGRNRICWVNPRDEP